MQLCYFKIIITKYISLEVLYPHKLKYKVEINVLQTNHVIIWLVYS
jgi:hypothetical protein